MTVGILELQGCAPPPLTRRVSQRYIVRQSYKGQHLSLSQDASHVQVWNDLHYRCLVFSIPPYKNHLIRLAAYLVGCAVLAGSQSLASLHCLYLHSLQSFLPFSFRDFNKFISNFHTDDKLGTDLSQQFSTVLNRIRFYKAEDFNNLMLLIIWC